MTHARYPVTVEEAKRLLTEHAWTEHQHGCEYCDHVCGPEPRTVIHTFGGSFGCDWTLESAIEFVEQADVIGWKWSLFKHNLAARSPEGRTVHFEVRAPDDVLDALNDQVRVAFAGGGA